MGLFKEEKVLINIPVKKRGDITLALAFPNTYSIGMASLGYQTVWKLLNQKSEVKVLRWFTDIKEETKSRDLPAYLGFSFSWELDYTNIFSILENHDIPLLSKDRNNNHPLVFAGGVVPNANPEPFADNFDFFLLGDLEVIYEDFLKTIVESQGLTREEKLNSLSKIPGVYVPCRDMPWHVSTKPRSNKESFAYSSILTSSSVWPNTFIVEVVRSCPELCRFCLASYGTLPFRSPSVKESLIPIIDFGLKHTNKIGLLGPSITQHPEFETLIDYLLLKKNSLKLNPQSSILNVQIASVRADTISQNLAEGLYKLSAKSVTMAVETGSERLRNIINKKVSNETIIKSIETIYNAGFKSIKLYGMVGLPHETQDDIEETIKFLKNLKLKTGNLKLTWSSSVFVPKATTPFQWYGVDKDADKKLKFLAKELHKIGIDFRPESYKWSQVQAFISRGDRSINKALTKAHKYRGTLGSFKKAIKEENIDFNYYVFKNWDINIVPHWGHIQGHLNKETIKKHALLAT